MGSNLPGGRAERIEWVESRAAAWSADPAAIGLTPQQSAQVSADLASARAAYAAALDARAAALVATQACNDAIAKLGASASVAIALIKAFAEATGDAQVYAQAMVSAPAPRGGARRCEQPYRLRAQLRPDGSIELRWRGRGAPGTRYYIRRQRAGDSALQPIADTGAAGGKRFIDTDVPAGTAWVAYQVVAKRGRYAAPPSEIIVLPLGAEPAQPAAAGATPALPAAA